MASSTSAARPWLWIGAAVEAAGGAGFQHMWLMDFVLDALFDGRRLRTLPMVDADTREALAINVYKGMKGEPVVETMDRIAPDRVAPRAIRVDNAPSSSRSRWTAGLMKMASRWTSRSLASRPIMLSWNRSMAGSATTA